jgi:hypothetical protein
MEGGALTRERSEFRPAASSPTTLRYLALGTPPHPQCCRRDTVPMPAEHSLDHAIRCSGFSPFKCRACRAKFYRRSNTAPKRPDTPPAPAAPSAPAPSVAVCQRDPASTLQRVEQIILVAEGARLRRG